jgi:hypothetical protein
MGAPWPQIHMNTHKMGHSVRFVDVDFDRTNLLSINENT